MNLDIDPRNMSNEEIDTWLTECRQEISDAFFEDNIAKAQKLRDLYDMVKTFKSSSQTNKNCWVLIATKYWINGKMYKTSDTLKSVSGLASSYKDFNWDDFPYGVGCKQFAENEDFLRKTMAHIGCFGRKYADYALDTSTGVGDIKIYDYAKYNKDFKVKL